MATPSSQVPSWAKHADFILIDIASLAVAFVLSYRLKFGNFELFNQPRWRALLAMVLLLDLAVTLLTTPYTGVLRRGYWEDIGASLKCAIWSFLAVCVAFYLLKIGVEYSREMLLVTYATYLLLSLILKALRKRTLLSDRGVAFVGGARRMVLVTTASEAEEAEKLVYSADVRPAEVVGFCLVDSEGDNELLGRPSSAIKDVITLAARTRADEVLVTVAPAILGGDILEELIEDGVRVRVAIDESLGFSAETQSLGQAGMLKTLDLERYSFGSGQMLYLPVKRAADVVFGVLGCVILVPVALAVKAASLASGDSAPIFYRQRRIGLRGEPFDLLKLRSMVPNAQEVLEELLEDPKYREEWERDQKLTDDPRITPVGRVLRRTSLDEFPQFVNVLKGDMSVIGPRPLVPGELEEHGGRSLYNKVKPGITGWWGCNGRSNIGYEERLELEYYYVRNCSLYLDVLCVLRTAAAVLRRDGAK